MCQLKLWLRVISIGFLVIVPFSLANVEIRTNVMDIYFIGTDEETGAIAFTITGDDFASASDLTPVFVRIELASDATLSKDLVTPIGSKPYLGPVFLAASLRQLPFDFLNNIDEEAIAIVRWVAGESAFWLRITQPTSEWIRDMHTGVTLPPADYCEVTFYAGVSASNSWVNNHEYFVNGYANLPSNRRNVHGISQSDSITTIINTDVSLSTLRTYPDPACYLEVEFAGFDEFTTGVSTATNQSDIILGNITSHVFPGDRVIARGLSFEDLGFSYFVPRWYLYQEITVLDIISRLNSGS